jgi:predicted MFS family arabinose efflux permease
MSVVCRERAFFHNTNFWMMGAVLFVQGVGIGRVMASLISKILLQVAPIDIGAASGLLATINQMGNAIGVALIGLVFFGLLEGTERLATGG